MARTKRDRRAYSAGEWGRNRVRVFPDPKTGLYQIEWRENGRRLTGSRSSTVTGPQRSDRCSALSQSRPWPFWSSLSDVANGGSRPTQCCPLPTGKGALRPPITSAPHPWLEAGTVKACSWHGFGQLEEEDATLRIAGRQPISSLGDAAHPSGSGAFRCRVLRRTAGVFRDQEPPA